MVSLIHINTPSVTAATSGTYAYATNSQYPFVTVTNSSSAVALIFSGGSTVSISGNNFTPVLPGSKETFSVNKTDTHFAITCSGNVYVQRSAGE